jgi:hypothetical protein
MATLGEGLTRSEDFIRFSALPINFLSSGFENFGGTPVLFEATEDLVSS